MREAYRLQKPLLKAELEESQQYLIVFFIYTGTTLPEYNIVYSKLGAALSRLEKLISR